MEDVPGALAPSPCPEGTKLRNRGGRAAHRAMAGLLHVALPSTSPYTRALVFG
jgi:hypothetical protein